MLRVIVIGATIGVVTLVLIPFQWIAVTLRLPAMRRIPVLYHRIVCALLDIHVTIVGKRVEERPLLIVSNHVSWLDISVITSVIPVIFVAKREVASWPLFGLLAKLQRSVFVDRNQRYKTPEVNAEIARRLADGDPVLLFGEGTSSDGNRVLPFRTALIDAARDTLAAAGHVRRVWIQPLSIAYTGLHGLPLSRRDRPTVAWYGDLTMGPHLAQMARHGAIDATVMWGAPVAFDAQSDRKAITRLMETEVRRGTALTLRGRGVPGPS